MKKVLITLLVVIIPLFLIAQVKKKIGFIPYTDPDNAEEEFRELAYRNIYDAALRVFVNTQRFDVLDRGSFNIIKIEKEFQKGEDLANEEIVSQGRVAAAQLLAVAKLSTFTVTESDDGEGFSVYITAEFKQIDVETNRATNAYLLKAEVIDRQERFGMKNNKRITTVEEAISKAVAEMEKDLEIAIKKSFPMILKVIGIDTDNDNTIVVEGGRNEGLTEKFKMKAVTITMYGDKILTKTIGKLDFLKEGAGEELTLLRMDSKNDWDDFMKAWKKNPDNIFVTEDL